MRRDLVEDERPERPIQHLEDFPVAFGAALVQLRVVAEVGLRELPERDVGLPADAVPALENPRAFLGLDVLRLVLVGGLRVPDTAAVDAEVVVP